VVRRVRCGALKLASFSAPQRTRRSHNGHKDLSLILIFSSQMTTWKDRSRSVSRGARDDKQRRSGKVVRCVRRVKQKFEL